MNDIRARFEEIWPVPEGVVWSDYWGEYSCCGDRALEAVEQEWNGRLDTFTRCQETTDVYVSLVDEMVAEIEHLTIDAYGCTPQRAQDILDRAKQIMEQSK